MESRKNGDLEVDLTTLPDNPHCPHGPTILFRRPNKSGKGHNSDGYYACSAYRDSKKCNFHLPFNKKLASKKRKRDEPLESGRPDTVFDGTEIGYCSRCSRILAEDEKRIHKHKEIQQINPRFPSRFLLPLDEKQNEAQYFFSKETVNFLLGLIKSQKVKGVIHIGCPRLHEEATFSNQIKAKNFLLDLDGRFSQFFPRTAFAQYNMFNNHFLTESGKSDFQKFTADFSSQDLLIVMDPPFGGRVEVLAHNLRQLFGEMPAGECSVVWIFPYFMERHITREFPNFTMLDYKIEYDNHRKFKKPAGKNDTGNNEPAGETVTGTEKPAGETNAGNKMPAGKMGAGNKMPAGEAGAGNKMPAGKMGAGLAQRGSPVRVFTNILPSSIPHPSGEGYWFCKECERFSAQENKHCLGCGACPSKDGKVWRHCRTCAKCVKSDWNHCKKCKRCHAKTCLAKGEEGEGEEEEEGEGRGGKGSAKKRSWQFSGSRRAEGREH